MSFGLICRARSGTPRLLDGDEPFRFVLANAYYLQEEAARGRIDLVDETFSKLARLGCRVVRTWAFNDDPNKADSAMRRSLGALEDTGMRGLDHVLARARAHGVRLILPLVNYWNAYGGTRQWCAWHGLRDPIEGDARFFTDARVCSSFAEHVARLLERRNTVTGERYGDDPTVLCWELMNEARSDGMGNEDLLAWVVDLGSVVRTHARQLVSLGDEGTTTDIIALDTIDLGSTHLYPEKWGVSLKRTRDAGVEWIDEHVRIAHAVGKPSYVGEFGLANEGAVEHRMSLAERRVIYRVWLDAAERAGAVGIGPWMFAYDSREDDWDDFTWYLRDGLTDGASENRYADLVAEAAARFKTRA